MLTKILPVEENVCNFKEGSSNMDPNAAVENLSVSLQSCEPFGVPDNDSPKVFIAPDILGTDVLLGAFNSISIVESSGRREHEGKDNVTFDDTSETKCPDIIYPSPRRRSTRTNKSNQKTQTKKAAGKRRKTANKKPLLDLILLRVARRRRSVLCKRARSSLWGLLGNVTQVFEQNIGLDVNQNEYKKSRKERSGRGSGKRNKNQAGRSSQRSKGKTCASASGIRLKVKLRKEVDQIGLMDMVPVIENGPERYWGTSIEFPKLDNDVEGKLEGEVPGIGGFQGCNGNPEKRLMLSDASVLDVHLTDKDPNSTLVAEKLAGITADNHHAIPCQIEFEGVGVVVDHTYLDPGTSPDSEVINLIPDGQFSGKVQVQEDLQDILISSQASVTPRDITSSNLPQTSSKKGKKKGKFPRVFNCIVEDILPSPEIINDTRIFEEPGQREKMGDGFYSSEASISITAGNTSGNTSSSEGFSREPLPSSGVTDFGVSCGTLKVESGAEVDLYSKLGVGLDSPASMISEKLLPYSTSKGRRLAKNSKPKGVYKGGPELPDSAGSRRGKACRKKGSQTKLVNKKKIKEKVDCEQVVCKVESLAETDDRGETKTGDRSTTEGVLNLGVVPGGIGEQWLPRRSAWVRCDDCYKWRRIPATLADSIEETNCKWICKDNTDKAFADCSTPQEKSNAEINAELEISDASCEEDACDARLNSKRLEQKHLIVPQQSSWMLIKSNLFLHRSRKTQTIDEIMVCHCKPPVYGQMGCGDGCLNRMLNIECVQGTCPCGEFCSNQQFHKGNYAKLRWFRCGKKGYGLQLLENISRGQFLIEYVGEVLHMHAYEERQREYALKGHKHFYFMTLNGSEVIDACAKGNLGRFINHSCDPNCRTEKWMVNGEVCIGLFALRDIKKGEEVTFDYNYVRVFGAAAKKCVCGSSQCRGYIGGDPLNTEVIVQGDSDEEYPEPVMLYKDGEIDEDLRNLIPALDSCDGTEMQIAENTLKRKNEIDKPATAVANLGAATKMQTAELLLNHKDEINNSMTAVGHLEIARENDSMNESVSAASKFPSSLEMESSMGKLLFSVQPFETFLQPDDLTSKAMATVQQQCSIADETMDKSLCSVQRLQTSSLTTINKSLSDSIDTKTKSKSDTVDDRRAFSKSKTSRSSSSVKKGKSSSYSMTVNKPQVMANKSHLPPYKPKRLLEGSSNDRFEAVQEKLNELLDADGGISKRKDAAKGYLKLLLLTAASGDSSNGEAIQSNRDLSMILDALLKTKSRLVLFDIINKNGLQMLHNIMKRYRSDFIKIPILRKLLKVLEYLAVREILTSEQINGGPPCPGVESFRESILTLTEHDDKQVHQIARNFRDKWIPRPVRKISCMERDNGRMEFHRGSNFNGFLASHDHWRAHSVRLTEAIDCVKQSTLATLVGSDTQEGLPTSCSGCATNGTKTRKRKSRWDQPAETNTPRSPRHKESKIQPSLIQKSYSNPQPEIGEVVLDHISSMSKDARGGKNSPGCMHNFSQQIESRANEGGQNIDEDVPPGFLPPRSGPLVSSNASTIDLHGEKVNNAECSCKVVMGHPQERFISRLSVSYGVPLSVMQQFGTPKADIVDGWFIAPGVPFDPFPPLPPYPREKGDPSTCDTHHITTNQRAEKVEHDSWNPATYLSNQETPSTSGSSTPDMMGIPGVNIQHNFQRARGPSFSLGGRYFRQQKWNNSKLGPPWIRKRNGWGSMGNNLRSGMCSIGIGSVANELKGSYNSAHVGTRVESACNYFYQDPHHQYQH